MSSAVSALDADVRFCLILLVDYLKRDDQMTLSIALQFTIQCDRLVNLTHQLK